ncbi:MAG: AAA family ATPase [Candidatus Rokubacteria bacterium]|nr:AAA family ATPase [Candidatus Rokubacteria bacterium]
MIQHLAIDRFKSIRSLSIPCRKVNVFIGEPDTGKTNILEALYLPSRLAWGQPLDSFLRLNPQIGFEALFYQQFLDQPFQILMRLSPSRKGIGDELVISATIQGEQRNLYLHIPGATPFAVSFGQTSHLPHLDWIRCYAYSTSEQWAYTTGFHLGTNVVAPPWGHNLLYIARHAQKVNNFLRDLISPLGWKLFFDQTQKTLRLLHLRGEQVSLYNLDLLSDSLKRLFFYGSILLTSQEVVLVFDEPDVFAFPPYPKTLGEMIAGDSSNQFFLITHNPYFLSAIAEKTPVDNLGIFVCFRDPEGATSVKLLSSEQVSRIIELGANVFFNLDELLTS